jgi:hypothetical protein
LRATSTTGSGAFSAAAKAEERADSFLLASTRPFLTSVEKRWIAFQLLTGLKYARERGVRDIPDGCEESLY